MFHARVIRIQAFEVTQELLGTFIQIARQHDLDAHELIPAAFPFQVRHPFAGEAEALPTLRAGRNLHHHWAIEGVHLDGCA